MIGLIMAEVVVQYWPDLAFCFCLHEVNNFLLQVFMAGGIGYPMVVKTFS